MLDFIPMTDTVTLQRAGGVDEWGIPVESTESQDVKARIDYNSKRKEIPVANGETIVYTAEVLIKGTPKVTYKDRLFWVDQVGIEHNQKPLSIEFVKNFSGKAFMTKVVV